MGPVLFASGAAALVYELVWFRRFALLFGSGPVSATLTVSTVFGGLGAGAWLARLPLARADLSPARRYASLEIFVAMWALLLPWLLSILPDAPPSGLGVQLLLVVVLAGPPALAMGASLPVLCAGITRRHWGRLYAWNTAGAVVGTLSVSAILLPLLGVRGAELVGVGLSALAGLLARTLGRSFWSQLEPDPQVPEVKQTSLRTRWGALQSGDRALIAVSIGGFVAMSLEIAWMRLVSILIGPSVHALAWVLAVFLAGIALGAAHRPASPGPIAACRALAALGTLGLAGTWTYGMAPVLLGMLYEQFGPDFMGLTTAALTALAMGGAPLASGVLFSQALSTVQENAANPLGAPPVARVYAFNTLFGVAGAALTGLWGVPTLGIVGCASAVCCVAIVGAALLARRTLWLVPGALLLGLQGEWPERLYAVGLHGRLDEFVDLSPQAIRRFSTEGWDPLFYRDGLTATVAVGRSTRTGNTWLSINGKVDASTGDDMPTQVLSGQLPARMSRSRNRALLVGLASGVTARALLDEGVRHLTVVELEPAVVEASRFFSEVNGQVLQDERLQLVLADGRAVLSRPGPTFDIIVSEPSNPWITGVSNLFTLEYWLAGRSRLSDGGTFCQWIQMYDLDPGDFRSLVATFLAVFPESWLFETVSGSDLLLVGGGEGTLSNLPLDPILGPEGL
ncbi:MAG: hypothetical protein QGG40_04100, partial [Myxococcota bacterium]|nr:hypothetical protein [Myxococcota bacterium]